MNLEQYLRIVASKIGPNAAIDLSRDVRMKAMESLLIEKGIATSEEIDAELDKQLGEVAQSIVAMPQFPIDSKITSSAEVKPDA